MIDLGATRNEMLAEIGAPAAPLRLADPSDPRFASCDAARLVVGGWPRRELFRLLGFALSARFAGAPRAERIRDLLAPLRSALGNAHKHGNGRDRSKRIEVEIVTTRKGALVAIGDEGAGFDVPATVARMRGGERYYTQHGSGLRAFAEAGSRVAWEDRGRTLLLRFLPSSCRPDVGAPLARALAEEVAGWRRGGDPREPALCGVAVEAEDAPGPLRVRCLLRERPAGAAHAELRVLSGRLFASGERARADLAAAAQLRERLPDSEIRIPRAAARLRSLPRLALYDFDPWLDLGEYLALRGPAALPGAARRVADLLAALHRSGGSAPEERWSDVLLRTRATGRRVSQRLAAAGAPEARRARMLALEVERHLARCEPRARAPIHGSFGLGCVHYGVDGRFAVDRFEGLRRSHPALDLAGFLADWVDPTGVPAHADAHGAGLEALFLRYLALHPDPTLLAQAWVCAASELLSRLDQRLERALASGVGRWLGSIERSLREPAAGLRSAIDARAPTVRS